MTDRSRRGSRQTRHSSCSLTLPQIRQKRTLSFTSVSAVTRRRTSAGSAASRWKAIRCALLGPTPGSRPSSSMRSWTAPSYIELHAREAEAAQSAGERTHRAGLELLRLARSVADGRDDEVLEALDVVRVDRPGVDLQPEHLTGAGDRGADQVAAGAALDLGLGELGLRLDQLLLHLLRLLHQLLHVRLSGAWHLGLLALGRRAERTGRVSRRPT